MSRGYGQDRLGLVKVSTRSGKGLVLLASKLNPTLLLSLMAFKPYGR